MQGEASQQPFTQLPMDPTGQTMMPPPVVQQPYLLPPVQNQQFMHGMPPGPYLDAYNQQAIYLPPQALRVQQQMQQGVQPLGDIQDTVDTNLSDFESRTEGLGPRGNTPSCARNDSMDPPPSVTDPDPWDMMPDPRDLRKRQAVQKEFQPPEPSPMPPRYGMQQQLANSPMLQHPGIPYEAYISGELGPNVAPETRPVARPSVVSLPHPQVPIGESENKRDLLTERLAGLRPVDSSHRKDESAGSTSILAKDTSEVADKIILGGSGLVAIHSIKGERSEPRRSTSHDDPPQHLFDKSSSLTSKLDESSLMTYGATFGSEAHPTDNTTSQELHKASK